MKMKKNKFIWRLIRTFTPTAIIYLTSPHLLSILCFLIWIRPTNNNKPQTYFCSYLTFIFIVGEKLSDTIIILMRILFQNMTPLFNPYPNTYNIFVMEKLSPFLCFQNELHSPIQSLILLWITNFKQIDVLQKIWS